VLVGSLAVTAAASGDEAIVKMLEPIRAAHHLPGLGGAIVTSQGLVSSGVTGVRKLGATPAATVDDLWHLGSDTKAMTATMIAILVERGQLSWNRTIGEAFGDRAADWPAGFRGITLTELLSHRAGLPANLDWDAIARSSKEIRQERLNAVAAAAKAKPESAPGTAFLYSNLGYTIAATMAEQATDKTWEDLMSSLIFGPLGMASCGFGGTGTVGQIDQPWPHGPDGKPAPANGPAMDNREVMGPAGTVHCSIADWSKFIADALGGARGGGKLLKAEGYKTIQASRGATGAAMGGAEYAFGWGVVSRPWAQGIALTHAGSNTMNYCVVWMAPAIDVAVLAVTNSGVADAGAATDEAVSALILSRVKK
jgi:CubicO group peptidase (beta-lactamase class C family)